MITNTLSTHQTTNFARRAVFALALSALASACTTTGTRPTYVNLEPAPLPVYQTGDAFFYQDDKGVAMMRRVVSAQKDRVDWITEERFRFVTSRNIFLPSQNWDGQSSSGSMTNSLVQEQLWPLEAGNQAEFSADFYKRNKKTNEITEYSENWRCKVNKPRSITVPAGTFDAYKVICRRYDDKDPNKVTRKHTWYYAPKVGHFIKRVKKYASGRTKTIELVSFTHGTPSS